MPLDTTTPSRSGATSGVPASAHASRAATIANCSHRSSRRAWTRSSTVAGSTAAGAAICTGRSGAQSSGSLRAPLRPASSDSQVVGDITAERCGRAQTGHDDTWLVCPHC